ncbi:hypothetical protein NBRC111894_1657 [Sporolactobacillus inulinus]|uniref:Uncharacterized protein n=1 Tax=Sporolactobacillus inulinus TaxID=2078 RepID=A0A4Y1ZAZ7_9BACL|nr:hypothetical protein [Sporolactobacillus inulinus]GAY76103.1 hypothetical protein NBRC111894_1657 [Sporolactobacillus inulinus]
MFESNKNRKDNFDRLFIGKPGCMSLIVIAAVAFIVYAIFIAH